MKKITTLSSALFLVFFAAGLRSQSIDSLAGFDSMHANEHLSQFKNEAQKSSYIAGLKRSYIKNKYNLFGETYFPYGAKTDSTAGCGNLDFENGSTAGWVITGDFQLMSGSGTDTFGCFPVVCPGGNYSIRLNDNNTTSSKVNFASKATKTVAITPANSTIKVNFAGCFEDFPHPVNSTSFLKIEFFDQLNNAIPSSSIICDYTSPGGFNTPSGIVSFISPVTGYNIGNQPYPVSYVPWQTETFNLSAYSGQNVVIKLTADWCIYNYDWAYAYFDVCCSSSCSNPPLQSCSTTGIKENEETADVSLMPNPFTNRFSVTGKNLSDKSVIILYNGLGQELIRKRMVHGTNLIQVSDLPSGIYFYSLFNDNQLIKRGKLVRE